MATASHSAVGTFPVPATARPLGSYPMSPHPGELEVYDVYPGGATSEDPAVAYDTVSYEPILNVLETLIAYNGSGSNGLGEGAFVPVLATCVPGTVACTTDYGSSLLADNATTGAPTYWTFVIDPAANFYDPGTGRSWGVYPTDVMFSIAREMAYSEAIGVGNTPGWLLAQALLPNGSTTWDGGVHAPYNTTPADILGSMLINDTNYCPAAAMTNAHGCVTFVADGGGVPWPQFLQLVGDGFMGITPCGWYTYEGAGLPGWGNISAANGDGSCLLPDGGTTTNSSTWTAYLAGLNPTSWDNFEENLGATYPAPAPNVQWSMVGSGPYYAYLSPSSSPPGYSLTANPAYAQPSGCSGAYGLAAYHGTCWPAAGGYLAQATIYYENTDGPGLGELGSGHADVVQFLNASSATVLGLVHQGKGRVYTAPTLNSNFVTLDLNYSPSAYATSGLPPGINIPHDFFSGEAAREFLAHAFDYSTYEEEADATGGIPIQFPAGGPIASGMDYYPTNVSYPYLQGNAETNASDVGGAAWWWSVGTTPGSGYYDPELAACRNSTCKFPLVEYFEGASEGLAFSQLTASIEAITENAVEPYSFSLNGACGFAVCPLPEVGCFGAGCNPGENPLPDYSFGWGADSFDPQDYLLPLAYPNNTFTYSDAVYQQFNTPEYNDPTACGHSAGTLEDLVYWADQPELNSSCEGVAYDVANDLFSVAAHSVNAGTAAEANWAIQAILNGLGLYLVTGQSYSNLLAAPWIAGASLNANPLYGGMGEQYWFQLRYVPYETPVTFVAKGLPNGSSFSVTAGANPPTTNNSNGTPTVGFFEPNGTLAYSFTGPTGYAVVKVTGPKGTTTQSSTVSGSSKGTVLTVTFKPVDTVEFAASGLSGPSWGVALTWASKGGPPDGRPPQATVNGTTVGASLTFQVAQGSWTFVVTAPAHYHAGPSKGSIGAKSTTTVKTVRFKLEASKIVFDERGLPAGARWGVNVTGTNGSCAVNGTTHALACELVSGTYSVSVWSEVGYSASAASTVVVAPPKGQTVKVTYIA